MLGNKAHNQLYLVIKYYLSNGESRMYVTRAAEYIGHIQRLAGSGESVMTNEYIGQWVRDHPVVSMHDDHATALQMVQLAEEKD
jgi:hypothetical protein